MISNYIYFGAINNKVETFFVLKFNLLLIFLVIWKKEDVIIFHYEYINNQKY